MPSILSRLLVVLSVLAILPMCGSPDCRNASSQLSDFSGDLADDGLLPNRWKHSRTWSLEEEKRYSEWIRLNYQTDFYTKRNITADCADAEMSRRAWYAIKRELPFAYRPIYDTSILVTSTGYDGSPRSFIDDMNNAVSTHNLPLNSYRLHIAKDFKEMLRPGIFFLIFKHHTRPVADIDAETGLLVLRESTTTKKPIPLMQTFLFETEPTDTENMRHQFMPIRDGNGIKLVLQHPSWEQVGPYGGGEIDFKKNPFFEWIQEIILGLSPADMPQFREKTVKKMVQGFQDALLARVAIVEEGYKACWKYHGSDPTLCDPGPDGIHSTPSRDERLKNIALSVFMYAKTLSAGGQEELFKWVMQTMTETKLTYRVIMDEGGKKTEFSHDESFGWIINALFSDMLSSDPRVTIQERWGGQVLSVTSASVSQDYEGLEKLIRKSWESCNGLVGRGSSIYNITHDCRQNPRPENCEAALTQLKNIDVMVDKLFLDYLDFHPAVSSDIVRFSAISPTLIGRMAVKKAVFDGKDVGLYQRQLAEQCFMVVDWAQMGGVFPPPLSNRRNLSNLFEFHEAFSKNKIKYSLDATARELWGLPN